MSHRRVESFLLRLVVSDDAQDLQHCRGRIQHIASGSELQIAEIEQVLAFIFAHLNQPNISDQCPPTSRTDHYSPES